MKKLLLFIILLFVLKVTNPGMQTHKAAITQKCKELNPVTGAIGGCNLYSKFSIRYVDYHMFGFTMSGQELISIGFLTMPFVIKNLDF